MSHVPPLSPVSDGGAWQFSKLNNIQGTSQTTALKNTNSNQTLINKKTIFCICVVAFSILPCAGGITLLVLKMYPLIGWSLIGSAGACAVGGFLIKVPDWICLPRATKDTSSYKIVSWDLGSCENYYKLAAKIECEQYTKDYELASAKEKTKRKETLTMAEALETIWSEEEAARAAVKKKPGNRRVQNIETTLMKNRYDLFASAFMDFEAPDIMCFQNTSEISNGQLKKMFWGDYALHSIPNGLEGQSCTIAWNNTKFSLLGKNYLEDGGSTFDTFVLLKDNENGKILCVCSTLLHRVLPETGEAEEAAARECNEQKITSNLQVMHHQKVQEQDIQPNVYIMAGGFARDEDAMSSLQDEGYTYDKHHDKVTQYLPDDDTFDASRAYQTDYIFAKSSKGRVKYGTYENESIGKWQDVTNFDRPSEHAPVFAEIKI